MRPIDYRESEHFPAPTEESTSALLRRILSDLPGEEVRVGYLVRQLRRRSFAGLFIVLGLLGLAPVIAGFAGLALLIPGYQLMRGYRAAVFPRFVRNRRLKTQKLRKQADRVLPWLEKLETVNRPRLFAITRPPVPTFVGLLAIGLGIVIFLPIPGSNILPAIALTCLSCGYLQRDGLMMLVGLVFGVAALLYVAVVAYVTGGALELLIERYFGWI